MKDFKRDWQKWSKTERISAILLSTSFVIFPLAFQVF